MHCLRSRTLTQLQKTRRLFSSPSCQVGLFGVCEDRNSSSKRGPAQGPAIIRQFFNDDQANGHTEYGLDIRGGNVIVDHGDISVAEHSHEQLYAKVDEKMSEIIKSGQIPLALGGDHSVTFPLVKALRKHYDRPVSIVHFDAHPDIYHSFEGHPYSHASPFARIMESTDPQLCERLLQIGIRTATPHQREQMKKFRSRTVDAKDFPANGGEMKYIFDTYLSEDSLVYISLDVDVLDPAFAPGVSHREPGGLNTRQVLDAIFSIPGRIVGADIVEYNPATDIDNMTAVVAAKLMLEFAGKLILSNTSSKPLKP